MENNGSVVDFELSSNSGHNVMAIMKFVAYDQVFRLFHCQCVCVCVLCLDGQALLHGLEKKLMVQCYRSLQMYILGSVSQVQNNLIK